MNSLKYSILIPVKNGGFYLESCVSTIISQSFSSFELIISDDHSTDQCTDFLKQIHDTRIRHLLPPRNLSMSEHWDWLAQQAKGEWVLFVGQDDGLMPYFFEHAELLTNQASQLGLRAIMSARAFYFWKGCEDYYKSYKLFYSANSHIEVRSARLWAKLALWGVTEYFDLPSMYSTSLFHSSLIHDARVQFDGKLIIAHPQDACLAAIFCSLEKKFLYSYTPLGWVGSSVKSAGLAMSLSTDYSSSLSNKELIALKDQYAKSITNSPIIYDTSAGEFSYSDLPIYFWQALRRTSHRVSPSISKYFTSVPFLCLFWGSFMYRQFSFRGNIEKVRQYNAILKLNHLSKFQVSLCLFPSIVLLHFLKTSLYLKAKWIHLIQRYDGTQMTLTRDWSDTNLSTIFDASLFVQKSRNPE